MIHQDVGKNNDVHQNDALRRPLIPAHSACLPVFLRRDLQKLSVENESKMAPVQGCLMKCCCPPCAVYYDKGCACPDVLLAWCFGFCYTLTCEFDAFENIFYESNAPLTLSRVPLLLKIVSKRLRPDHGPQGRRRGPCWRSIDDCGRRAGEGGDHGALSYHSFRSKKKCTSTRV